MQSGPGPLTAPCSLRGSGTHMSPFAKILRHRTRIIATCGRSFNVHPTVARTLSEPDRTRAHLHPSHQPADGVLPVAPDWSDDADAKRLISTRHGHHTSWVDVVLDR
jgi:hypothetical protein